MTQTELHTHLMGMLSADGFLSFLAQYDYELPIDENFKINFNSQKVKRVKASSLLSNQVILNQLSIKNGRVVNYEMLNDFYYIRSMLIKDLISDLDKITGADNKVHIYRKYLEKSLSELINQNVSYVEISFSNIKLIDEITQDIDPNITSKIKCNFLASTDRSNEAKVFKKCARNLVNIIDKGYSVGFDIMGSETPLTSLDLDNNSKYGLYQKLLPLVNTLHSLNETTLRIHSGETPSSRDNTEKVLKILKQIKKDLKISIPPPEIRIGHGIHFNKNQNYIDLLKEFNCIVEINASSNYALSNINDYDELPYNYYLDNNIPLVISSDGHGLYDTNKNNEDTIAKMIATKDNQQKIKKIDKDILNKSR